MRRLRNPVALLAALLLCVSCAHRYSEDRADWVGPRGADFDADLDACQVKMRDEPFRFRGDPRLIFLDCMGKRGWHLKGSS
jgi:hypothetical protein